MRIERLLLVLAMLASLAFVVAACGDDDDEGNGGGAASGEESSGGGEELSGTIRIDGSSTVFPFAEAAAELFNEEQPNVQITVGQSGTGGGFEKFCAGETDISDASRPINDEEEAPVCEKAGVKYDEVQVANDGIAVVTNKDLDVDCLTVDQLKQLWEPKSKVAEPTATSTRASRTSSWRSSARAPTRARSTSSPSEINGEEGASREDYEASEDDNQLVTGVAGTEGGLGYFGFSYYEANKDKLNLVRVDDGSGCVAPTRRPIQDGSYKPLSRPLFMYPSEKALAKPEVKAFMDFALANQQAIAEAAKIVPMTEEQATEAKSELKTLEGGA